MSFKIHLIPDDYHLTDVGQLENGMLYWTDIQLDSDGRDTRDFVATYVFNAEGRLIQHTIDDLGWRSDPAQKSARETIAAHKEKLGTIKETDIWVYPFSVNAYGLEFGLVVREPEDDEEAFDVDPLVDALPGWTLLFYPPWEEGAYDT